MDDEIDLKPYIMSALRSWRVILLITVLAGGIVLALGLLSKYKYKATATLIITRSRSELSLGDQFETILDRTDLKGQNQAILLIAKSDAITKAVLDEMRQELPENMLTLENFEKWVNVVAIGDAINIEAAALSPDLAAKIANIWAEKAVELVNRAYSGQQPLSGLDIEIQSAALSYDTAQNAYETFIQTNQLTTLSQQIEAQKQIQSSLQQQLHSVLTLSINTQVGLSQGLASSYLNKLLTQRSLVFTEQSKWVEERYTYHYNRQASLERLLTQAQALQTLVSTGGVSEPALVGDALAVMIARARIFGVGGDNITLQIDASNLNTLAGSPSEYKSDLARMITEIQSELDDTEAILLELEAEILSGDSAIFPPTPLANNPLFQAGMAQIDAVLDLETPGDVLPDYQNRPLVIKLAAVTTLIQDLQAKYENELANSRELTTQRDLTWTTYQALLRRQTELVTSAQVNNIVAIASIAIPPEKPAPRGTLNRTLMVSGAVLGMCLLVVWGRQWWRSLTPTSSGQV